MKKTLHISILLSCLFVHILPAKAVAQNIVDQKSVQDRDPSLVPTATDSAIVAKMLRTGVDLSWLFEPVLLKRIVASPDEQAKAETILGLARVAAARGLDRRPDVLVARQGAEAIVLAEAARRNLIDSIAVPDTEVAARIAGHPGRYDEYRLSHIFIAVGATPDGGTRDDAAALALARQIARRIAGGEDFSAVARSVSEDRATAADGGMLSGLLGVTMNPAFFAQVQALKVHGTTEPVRGPDGYHLIRLEARRVADVESARFWVEQDVIGEKLPAMIAQAIAATRVMKTNDGNGKR